MVFVVEPRIREVALELVRESSPRLRAAGRDLLFAQDEDAGLKSFREVFEGSSIAEQQAAIATLAVSPARNAFALLASQADKVVRGELPSSLALDFADALERSATLLSVPTAERGRRAQQREKLLSAWLGRFPATDKLRDYRMALEGGDALRGRTLFHTKVEYLCIRCHKVEGTGTSDVGPDLTGLGKRRARDYILRAIVDPGAEIAAGFEFVTLTLRNGDVVAGQVDSETETAVRLKAATEGKAANTVLTVNKSDIAMRVAASAMPPLVSLMSQRELRDLVEYLTQQ